VCGLLVYNGYGELGLPASKKNIMEFQKVIDGGVKGVVGGYYHTVVLKTDGTVMTTGNNKNGQLGSGSTEKNQFRFVEAIKGVQEIGGGCCCYHSIVRKQDGTLWGAGDNTESQLGIGSENVKNLDFRAITNVV